MQLDLPPAWPMMQVLMGLYWLLTLGCTFHVLKKYFIRHLISETYPLVISTVFAFLIVVSAWGAQSFPKESYALREFDKLIIKWEAGEKQQVIKELDSAVSQRPWDRRHWLSNLL